MKKTLFTILLSMFTILCIGKTCRVCGGLGHPFGNSQIVCSACGGSGIAPASASDQMREARDRENYANSANDLMESYNLTPEEYFAYEELIKQAMEQVPVYETCATCGGTGDCSMCGGYMNVSLDDDLCRVCGGSGICISCSGAGRMLLGYQDNPQKQQLIDRANEILHHGQPQNGSQDTYGTYNNPGDASSFDSSYIPPRRGTPVGVILLVIVALGLLGWLGYRHWKKKRDKSR
ncbi:MAG: hypothetical protein J5593_04315 [Bacteroidaceae bacterium]|nr:hypothetical protein [Bacteroidaceae bacterium]